MEKAMATNLTETPAQRTKKNPPKVVLYMYMYIL